MYVEAYAKALRDVASKHNTFNPSTSYRVANTQPVGFRTGSVPGTDRRGSLMYQVAEYVERSTANQMTWVEVWQVDLPRAADVDHVAECFR